MDKPNKKDYVMMRIPKELHDKLVWIKKNFKWTHIGAMELAIDEFIESHKTHQKQVIWN